jgi:hypothetical protein
MEQSLVQAPPRILKPLLQVLQLIEDEHTRQLVMPQDGSQAVLLVVRLKKGAHY